MQISIPVDDPLASSLMKLGLEKLLGTKPIITEQSVVPTLGSYWPGQGGYNAGLMRGENGSLDYYLIVPLLTEQIRAEWGGYGEECEGATSSGDGAANTKALLADSNEHPAAKLASEFTADGHSDFYLPARRELQVAEANVPELFEKAYHWSSTQYSANGAYTMGFGDGWLYYDGKNLERLVRPVRRFIP
ncbi:DUF1566 domain-containing protein [Pseudomonas sp. MSSRFD41]|uniref:DUF1566 domain-containing protein n=1 Tax=Pseudomonas sp. MSSRFD41 TaxID=1310370 RepID=UPI00163A87DB|nr:DUF1566 domain-containing protein [Pseudomonas sp. MSSRFD41]MBC2655515.1 DUF1566 domain-containing protein [Pseudomonas sp. MSSRFD41]MBC2660057.1 DUF1566 domain-containing protein [Pseudomonas sp. MSSRFD41]